MVDNPAHRLLHPATEADRNALACLMRLRSEGCGLAEMADRLRHETGFELAPAELDGVVREIAGPVPQPEGGDPSFFSGYLGGG
ncbi:MAG: hypothetical protein AB7I59_06155 [Geminicoccaceae bacterium]